MSNHRSIVKACALTGFLFFTHLVKAQESVELAIGRPEAIVDLRTSEGTTVLKADWRFMNANIVSSDFKSPGPSMNDAQKIYPTGKVIKTHAISPKAGPKDFDDSKWERLAPNSLEVRRGKGLLSFVWYRIRITVPKTIGKFEVEGSSAVFEIVMDDYAEVIVNGGLGKTHGQAGGQVVKGWNARNRVVIGKDLKPGQEIQLAILGMNAPISDLPENYIWIRSATVDFYREFPVKNKTLENLGEIVTIDPALHDIIDEDSKLTRVATGFQFTEGPVWHPDGFLLFSDPNTNVIYAYKPDIDNVEIFRTKSGYSGFDVADYHQPGSNGLAFDPQGRLTVCQHGERRVIRIEPKGPVTVMADEVNAKQLNSPNDLVYRSDGVLFFTDPPYGLPKAFDDPGKELAFSGVYAVVNGKTVLVANDLKGPNGIAFSPDEKYLYVSNWDITDIHNTKVIRRYDVSQDGTLSNGRVFFSMNQTDGDDALDGLKVDTNGNVFCAGPDGIWIISSEGKYVGRIRTPEHAANMAWGEDGKTLFITASTSVYKIRLKTHGTGIFLTTVASAKK